MEGGAVRHSAEGLAEVVFVKVLGQAGQRRPYLPGKLAGRLPDDGRLGEGGQPRFSLYELRCSRDYRGS